MAGPLALVSVCLAALAVGVAVASWGFARDGRLAALAASMGALAYLYLPVHALGWVGALTPGALAAALGALALVVLGPTLALGAARERWLTTAGAILRLARDGVVEPLRALSVAAVGVAAVVGLTVWTAALAYLLPSSSWDGPAYHEPMIALALQNQGFDWVGWGRGSLLLPQVDGFPRLLENVMLVFAVAWDRRVIDMVPSALFPVVVLSVYALLRRFVRSRFLALGLACVFAFVPAVMLELRSTMVDLAFVACCAAALVWASRPDPGVAELWQLGLAVGLLAASKVTGLYVAPFAVGLAAVSVARGSGGRRRLAHLAGALLLAALLAAPTYLRNLVHTGNPLWPAKLAVLGLHLDGELLLAQQNEPLWESLERMATFLSYSHHDAGSRNVSYGYVFPVLLLPLAGYGVWSALTTEPDRGKAWRLVAVAVPLLAFFAISPARYWGRLNLHVILGGFVLAGYAIERLRPRLQDGVLGLALAGSLALPLFTRPHWLVSPADALVRASWPSPIRAVEPAGSMIALPYHLARARERDLGPGDLVLIESSVWFGLYWNERFDNRVEHLDADGLGFERWREEADRRGAEWVVLPRRHPLVLRFERDRRWRRLGATRWMGRGDVIYRRAPVDEARLTSARPGGPAPRSR